MEARSRKIALRIEKIKKFEEEEEKTFELILEMLEMMNDEVVYKVDIKKVMENSLDTEIVIDLFTAGQVKSLKTSAIEDFEEMNP